MNLPNFRPQSYVFCPYCFNNPPFPDMRTGLGCNSCTHPTCAHGQNSNGVSNCFECERGGILVLDQASGPKWKLSCNQCDIIVKIFEDAQKVRQAKQCQVNELTPT